MELLIEKYFGKSKTKIYLIDIIFISAIYFIPTFSHMLSLPIYFIEPMRLALVISMIYTNRTNALFLAVTLPLFSYIISSHPVLIKSILITSELLLNVFLFYYLIESFNNRTLVFAVSIGVSKIYYYLIKFLLLQFVILEGALVSTPLVIQFIMIFVFSAGYHFLSKKNK